MMLLNKIYKNSMINRITKTTTTTTTIEEATITKTTTGADIKGKKNFQINHKMMKKNKIIDYDILLLICQSSSILRFFKIKK
jgi:hypothetical protein